MAIVRHLEAKQLDRDSYHSETECTYSIVHDRGGSWLQIDTYGSTEREMPGKKSQSIRFAPEAIDELREIIKHFRK